MAADRLEIIKCRMSRTKVYYSAYNPQADYLHDIENAEGDFLWMIYETESSDRRSQDL